jgi:hypothetical protein
MAFPHSFASRADGGRCRWGIAKSCQVRSYAQKCLAVWDRHFIIQHSVNRCVIHFVFFFSFPQKNICVKLTRYIYIFFFQNGNATNLTETLFSTHSGGGGGGTNGQIWHHSVQQAIETAFSMARSSQHKTPPPRLDLKRCLNIQPPIKFLQILWAEIQAAANMGEIEACRRIATFVLATPQIVLGDVDVKARSKVTSSSTTSTTTTTTARQYPLLPIFLHVVLPAIIAEADGQLPHEEQSMRVDLLVAVLSSVLNAALHLEWALRTVLPPDRPQQLAVPVLGQTSNGMARRLAVDLRRNRTSGVSKMILQRLAASHAFVANFPVFKSELGT